MKSFLTISALLLGSVSTARAASLAEQLPAGALLTLETRNAGGAIDRFAGIMGRFMDGVAGGQEAGQSGGQMVSGFQQILKGSLGQEAALGVFSVGTAGRTFSPEVLAVTRVDKLSGEFFGSMLKPAKGARVGNYVFSRQGTVFAGMSGGLAYFSTNKDLLMGYLGRLSGKTAPRLLNSLAYNVPTRSVGRQELSLFLNFSATAKVIRSALAQIALPRLLSPVVDALDTLGQYSAGFTTGAAGLSAASAHAVSAQGKDKPLYRILTDSTDFAVQSIIPADAETVRATACHPESGAYLGRWLTRVDLIDPLGFLTDSQLASHLERSAQYLGHECAQVTLAGGLAAGLNTTNPLASLAHTVRYQRVANLDAARAHLPEYVGSVNAAIAGASDSLKTLLKRDLMGQMGQNLPGEMGAAGAAGGAALNSSLKMIDDLLGNLKMVYGFRGDYLITAFSQTALDAALDESAAPLSQDAGFRAAGLNMKFSAGWTYARNPEDITGEQITAAMLGNMGLGGAGDLTTAAGADDTAMGDDSTAMEDLDPAETMAGLFGPVGDLSADLINRYDGQTSQRTVQGNLITSKSNVLYRW